MVLPTVQEEVTSEHRARKLVTYLVNGKRPVLASIVLILLTAACLLLIHYRVDRCAVAAKSRFPIRVNARAFNRVYEKIYNLANYSNMTTERGNRRYFNFKINNNSVLVTIVSDLGSKFLAIWFDYA